MGNAFDKYGALNLKPYFIEGNIAVPCFFIIVFYFLISKTHRDIEIIPFIIKE